MGQQAPGKMLLLVTGIIYILLAAVGIFSNLTVLAGAAMVANGIGAEAEELRALITPAVLAVTVLGMAQSILGMAMGVLGVRDRARPERARPCLVLGVIVLVMSLASAVGTLAAQGLDPAVLAGKVIGVLIPALYTYGAWLNKRAAA